jgi:hypothetical protein
LKWSKTIKHLVGLIDPKMPNNKTPPEKVQKLIEHVMDSGHHDSLGKEAHGFSRG